MRFGVAALVLAACSTSYADGGIDGGSPVVIEDASVPTTDGGGTSDASTDADARTDAAADADAGSTACLGALDCERIIFVTSTATSGDRGGLLAADAECQALADASARTKGRNFRAWLSNQTTSATSRVPHGTKPYRRTDGVVVQNDYASMFVAGVLAPINIDENGAVVPTSEVWTGTNDDGTSLSAHCAGWQTGDAATFGRQGSAAATDLQWTDRGANLSCANPARIYCFEN